MIKTMRYVMNKIVYVHFISNSNDNIRRFLMGETFAIYSSFINPFLFVLCFSSLLCHHAGINVKGQINYISSLCCISVIGQNVTQLSLCLRKERN